MANIITGIINKAAGFVVRFPADTGFHGFEVQRCGRLHGCNCGGDSGGIHHMGEIRAAEYR